MVQRLSILVTQTQTTTIIGIRVLIRINFESVTTRRLWVGSVQRHGYVRSSMLVMVVLMVLIVVYRRVWIWNSNGLGVEKVVEMLFLVLG